MVNWVITTVNTDHYDAMAAADFNSDGRPDVAAINASTHTLYVYRGNGDGTFLPPSSLSLGTLTPSTAVANDVNGDGKGDLVLTESGANRVDVLLGDGTGRFAPAVTYAVGTSPAASVVADFNHDGRPDIITANTGSASFSVLLQSPGGAFYPGPTVPAPFNPTYLTTADFNNDNNLDVAAVGNSANVVVLFGNGDGTFSTYTPLVPGTTSHSSVVAEDFNNDGWVDLAVSQSGPNHQLAQLLNMQNGSFSVPSFTELNSYGGPMIPGHFVSPTSNDLIMTQANGSVNFGVTFAGGPFGLTRTDPPPSLGSSGVFATADFNGDGLTDFVCTGKINSTLNQTFFQHVQPLAFVGVQGFGPSQPSNVSIFSFSDLLKPDPSTLHPLIDWGDGRSSGAAVIYDGGINYHLVASHTYLYTQFAQYTVSVTDNFGDSVSFTAHTTVSNGTANTSASTQFNRFSITPFWPAGISPDGTGNFWVLGHSDSEYAVRVTPNGSATAYAITNTRYGYDPFVVDPQHSLWVVSGTWSVAQVTTAGVVKTFATPTPVSNALASGPDGQVWVVALDGNYNPNAFSRFSPGGFYATVPFQTPLSGLALNMVLGGDGNFWITETAPFIARVTPTGQVTEFPIPLPADSIARGGTQITRAPDGTVWCAVSTALPSTKTYLARITPNGQMSLFQVPAPGGNWQITAAADGSIWFDGQDSVARMNPQGQITYYKIPAFNTTGVVPVEFGVDGATAAFPDGNIWFTDADTNTIGRIDPTRLLNITSPDFQLPQGGTFSGQLLSFTDPNGARPVSSYDATVDWGDGTRTVATITAGPNNSFIVSASHTYLAQGQHNVAVSISPPGDIVQTQYVGENIPPAPVSLVSVTPIVVQRNTPTDGKTPFLVFYDPDPSVTPGQLSVTGFANMVVSAGAVPGQFLVTAQNTFADPHTETVPVRVSIAGQSALVVNVPLVVYQGIYGTQSFDLSTPGSGFIVTGDFNNDQIPDIVSASQSTLSVLLGNGDNTFKQAANSTAPTPGGNLVTGDFNQDGNLDLAYPVQSTTPMTAILLGNGNGTFAPAITLAMSSTHLVAADFSGDGITDLVGSGGPALQIAVSMGDGTFTVSNLPISGQLDQLVTGDFNADLNADLALVSHSSGTAELIVLMGNGNGTFGPPAAQGLGFTAPGTLNIAAGDIDRDGRTDLLVTNASTNQMIVLHGNGDGSFAPAAPAAPLELSPSAAPQLSGAALVDFNEDGNPDLVTADTSDNQLRIRVGLGNGAFAAEFPFSASARLLTSFALTDFNGDAAPDIAVGSAGAGIITQIDNLATGGLSAINPVAGTFFAQPDVFTFVSVYAPLDTTGATATIDWGDGTSSPGQILRSLTTPGTFTVSGSHVFKHPGLYNTMASIHRNQFLIASLPAAIFVTQPTLTFSFSPRVFINGQPATDAIALFNDPNPYSRPSDFSASVNLGNGTTPPGIIQRDPTGGPGDYRIIVTQASASSFAGFVNVTRADGVTQRYNYNLGLSSPRFGGATISGSVFNDLNRDGVLQAGEGPQFGWRVFDDVNANGVWDSIEPSDLVSANGTYQLSDVPAGNANVKLQLPSGWTVTPPTPAAGFVVPINSGQAITGINFSTAQLPPVVVSSRFNYDSYPRSATFTFSEPVLGAASPGAYVVYNVDTGQPYAVASASFDTNLNVLTLSFAGNLPNGNYEAVLYSQAITDSVGQHLGANPDGTGGADAYLSFYSLAGDVNRDGVVDFNDTKLTYSVAGDYAHGDVNGDGYVDGADGIIIARNFQKRIQRPVIHPGDLIASSTFGGTIYDIAPDGTKTVIGYAGQPEGVASDSTGNVYIAEVDGSPVDHLVRISNTGVQSTFTTLASNLSNPEGLVLRPDGSLMVTGWFGANPGFPPPGIATITPDGQIHPYVNCGVSELIAATLDSAGNLYAVDVTGDNGSLWKVTPSGVVTEVAKDLVYATGVAVAPDGTVLVSDSLEDKIWAVAPDGTKSVYLSVTRPFALLFDPQGNLYIGQDQIDSAGDSTIIRVGPNGTQAVIATGLNGVRGLAFVAPPPFVLGQSSSATSSNSKGTTTTAAPPPATTPVAPPSLSPKGGKPAPHDKGPKTANADSKLRTAASISSTPVSPDSQSKDKKSRGHQ
jgi:streptogramin lyase